MANIVFWLEPAATRVNTGGGSITFDLHGLVLGDEGTGIAHHFEALNIPIQAQPTAINNYVRDAAIAQFERDEPSLTVDALNRKTFIGGCIETQETP